jgi:type IV fimbrial biogenesis protein FimT
MATTHSNTNYSMRHSRRPLGVTLIELMVTLAVMAVLVTIAAPSFSRLIASDSDDTVLRESAAAPGKTTITRVTMSGSTATTATTSAVPDRMYVTFNALGGKYSGTAAYFKVCDSSIPSLPGRVIQVSLVGRASLYLNNISCP